MGQPVEQSWGRVFVRGWRQIGIWSAWRPLDRTTSGFRLFGHDWVIILLNDNDGKKTKDRREVVVVPVLVLSYVSDSGDGD